MFTRMILPVLFVFTLVGCATNPKKQITQSQPVAQESYSQDYDYDDAWSSDSYEKPAKKTYPEAAIQLSPKQIQRALKSAGFYQGPIDGKIGSKTKEAIIKFQKAKGLKADGIVGKRTSAQLSKYLSR
ncbi:MAG: peptidoglycan-binding domain-containing protein [Candidatus Omnitrophica bacterium]|nr:peptidoglycan-binding domain-containing protein [Candidatus Omnitrophota bacterium]MDD5592519.1 peptidoglycan-binding domain-containing protein [Candidatus Omnitrophota bacterium]